MILDFTIKNYKSFKNTATLSLEAEGLKDDGTHALFTTKANDTILPVVGIFGPNASGKSNILKALSYMQWAVLNSNYLQQPTTIHPLLQPFALNNATQKEPIHFEIDLWDKKQSTEYRYGFAIGGEVVVREWLEVVDKPQKNQRTRLIFERDLNKFTFDKSVQKDLELIAKNVLPTALAVSVFAQFANPIALKFTELIGPENVKILDGASADVTQYALEKCLKDPALMEKVVEFLRRSDLGIDEIKLDKEFVSDDVVTQIQMNMPKELRDVISAQKQKMIGYKVNTVHRMHNDDGSDMGGLRVVFQFGDQESAGTQKLFGLAAVVFEVLDRGDTLVFDELGSTLHPFITKAIVDLFQNKKTNKNGAQLIFTSHETYLLTKKTDLRRDQIWFTEKTTSEESVLRSLSEYKTRNDYELAKRYLEGRFGAVPILSFEDM